MWNIGTIGQFFTVGIFSAVRHSQKFQIIWTVINVLQQYRGKSKKKKKKEATLVISLFLGKAVFGKTIILINSNNGLLVPESKAGRLSWESWEHCGSSIMHFNKSFLTAGVICRTMFTINTGQDEWDNLRSTIKLNILRYI